MKDAMRREVATCRAELNLAVATALMWEYSCCALPVIAPSGQVIGIVTDRDICLALGARNARPSDLRVIDVLQDRALFSVDGDGVGPALKRTREGFVRRLPAMVEDLRTVDNLSIAEVALRAVAAPATSSEVPHSDVTGDLQATHRRRPRGDGSVCPVT
jgi:CBS domain-containing protein